MPFLSWSIDAAGLFPKDADGNRFLLVAFDPFSKWVEARPVPSLHSWRAAEFLEDIMHQWGKLRYVRTNHGLEYKGSFARLCKVLRVVHLKLMTGNSKGNGQVEHVICTIRDAICRGLTQWLDTFWSDHVGPALMLLCFTIARVTRIAPFAMATGCNALLLSVVVPPMPLPEEPSPRKERL